MELLHELIHNMSMAERSYFKRYAGKLSDDSSTNYLQLFDAVAAQDDYDEAALKKKFAREKFVRQFSVAKNYLYKTIIKALRNFNEESNVHAQLKSIELELAVLMDKGIYGQARKVILKGIDLAGKFEMFSDLNELLSSELYLLMNNYIVAEDGDNIAAVTRKQQDISRKIFNLTEFESLYQQQHQLNKSVYQLREGKHLEEYTRIFEHSLMGDEKNALSERALYYFHFIKAVHFSVTDNRKAFLNESAELVALCKSSNHFSGYDIRSSMNALNLHLEATFFNEDWAGMNKSLVFLKGLNVKSDRDKIAQFVYYSRFGLIYYDQKGDAKSKMQLIDEAWKTLNRFERKIPFHIRISLIVTYVSALLEMGQYAKSLDWISFYRQGKTERDVRFDVQSILLMMQLIAHYELKDLVLVKNIVPNISRFIKKGGQQGPFEKILLSFFNKLTSARQIERATFEQTLKELNLLKAGDILARNRTMHDVFRVFIESKRAGKHYHQWLQLSNAGK